mgnify:CR=1 FL=1
MNEELSQYLKKAKNIVVFTGAGISTESGIPDFRGPQGVWKTNTPIYFQEFIGSEEVRRESWKRKFSGQDIIKKAKPNIGHLAVAEIINKHQSAYLITQNVDNLHQDAGVPDNKITEIHGNASYATCLDCGVRYELKPIKKAFIENISSFMSDEFKEKAFYLPLPLCSVGYQTTKQGQRLYQLLCYPCDDLNEEE